MTDENYNGESSRVKQAIDVLLQHHLHIYSADENIMELRINRLGVLKNNKFKKTYMQVQ